MMRHRSRTDFLRWPARLALLPDERDDPELPGPPDRRRAALLGLLFTLLLVLAGVVLVHILGRAARLQDCVLSGRTNCAPIESSERRSG